MRRRPNGPRWLLESFGAPPTHLRGLASTDLERRMLQAPFDTLSKLLASLHLPTGPVPARVREMVGRGWDLVSRKVVPVVCALPVTGGEEVPNIALAIVEVDGVQCARLFLPLDYAAQVDADGIREMGLVVYCLAQAVAFVGGNETGPTLQSLGEAYHAEYLRALRTWAPRYLLSGYQRRHLARWPQGLDTRGARILSALPPEVRA